jgi:hypothetical protein
MYAAQVEVQSLTPLRSAIGGTYDCALTARLTPQDRSYDSMILGPPSRIFSYLSATPSRDRVSVRPRWAGRASDKLVYTCHVCTILSDRYVALTFEVYVGRVSARKCG